MIPLLIILLIATIIIGYKIADMALEFGFEKGEKSGIEWFEKQAVEAGKAEYLLGF
jgi:hypothetical protein